MHVCEGQYACHHRSRFAISCFISSTIKQDCKAGIKLSLTDDGQHLVVSEMNEEHNHDISKVSQS